MKKLEILLSRCKESIKRNKDRISQLTSENQQLQETLEETKVWNNVGFILNHKGTSTFLFLFVSPKFCEYQFNIYILDLVGFFKQYFFFSGMYTIYYFVLKSYKKISIE